MTHNQVTVFSFTAAGTGSCFFFAIFFRGRIEKFAANQGRNPSNSRRSWTYLSAECDGVRRRGVTVVGAVATENPAAKETHSMKKDKQLDPLLKPEEVAKKLGFSKKTILVMAREDRIPCIRIGRFIRFDAAEIDRWLDRRRS